MTKIKPTYWAIKALGQTRVTESKHLDGAVAYEEVIGHKPYWWTNATVKQLATKRLPEEKQVEVLRNPEGWQDLGWNPEEKGG